MSNHNKRVIGITGGIGAGKTRVLELIKKNYDALIIEADKIGHELQKPGEAVYTKIVTTFGEEVLEALEHTSLSTEYQMNEKAHHKSYRKIDRKKLGAIVFDDHDKLELLNSITHPAIHNRISELISASNMHLIFVEAAILTETSLVDLTDAVWYIYADMPVRLERLQKYRLISEEMAVKIMANQPDENYFRKRCRTVIDNSFSEENTLKQIDDEIKKIQEEYYE